jgi:acyl dehydratase
MGGRYYEDFSLDERFSTARRTITETDIVNFVNLIGWQTPLFTDMEYVRGETVFKERIAPGALVLSIALAQFAMLGLTHGTALAMVGLQVRFTNPARPGDTIGSEVVVASKQESTKGDRGTVEFKYTVSNQKGGVVAEMNEKVLFKKRT